MKHLKELRAAKKMSQQDVANYLGITRQAYSNYENGNRDPDNETLLKLAEFFDVTVDTLLRGNEKKPTPEGERNVTDDDIKFALWGDVNDIDDDDLEDVRRYAAYIRERKKNKK